jgi:hypothetical protein
MDAASEAALPADALLSVATLHGPDVALRAALAEARDGLPLPIGFLMSQPGQVLPALARHLAWRGDGRCLAARDPAAALALACAGAPTGGMLLGWVDEDDGGRSLWLRLVADAVAGVRLRAGAFAELADPALTHLAVDAMRLRVGARAPAEPAPATETRA